MLGWPEILLILGVMLLVLGPSKLPEMARSLGHAFKEFQNATINIENEAKTLTNSLPDLNAPILNVPPNIQIQKKGQAVKAKPVESIKMLDDPTVSPPSQLVNESSTPMPLETPETNENLVEVAKVLGISIKGRSEEDLKTAIHDKIEGLHEKEV
jgi:TatA/E family protein of Tat protein translocase